MGFTCGILALRIFHIIYMYKISFIGLKSDWRRCAAVRSYNTCPLLHRNLPYQTHHLTPIFTSFCACSDPQFDILGISCFDMVEFHIFFHIFLCGGVRLQANKKILEPMDWRKLHRRSHGLRFRMRLQCCFWPFDLDSTSTSYMESADTFEKEDRDLGSLSC